MTPSALLSTVWLHHVWDITANISKSSSCAHPKMPGPYSISTKHPKSQGTFTNVPNGMPLSWHFTCDLPDHFFLLASIKSHLHLMFCLKSLHFSLSKLPQELLGFTKEICLAQQDILLTMLLVPFYLLNCKERSELCKYYQVWTLCLVYQDLVVIQRRKFCSSLRCYKLSSLIMHVKRGNAHRSSIWDMLVIYMRT